MVAKLKKKSRAMTYAEADGPLHQSNSPAQRGPAAPTSTSISSAQHAVQLRPNTGRGNVAVAHYAGVAGDFSQHEPQLGADDQKRGQYWAARALQAETVLRIREVHYRDMRSEVEVQSEKREMHRRSWLFFLGNIMNGMQVSNDWFTCSSPSSLLSSSLSYTKQTCTAGITIVIPNEVGGRHQRILRYPFCRLLLLW